MGASSPAPAEKEADVGHRSSRGGRRLPAGSERILIYGINYAPEMIGVGRYSGELGAYLAECGHTVDVVTAPPHYPGWQVTPPFRNTYAIERSGSTTIMRCPLVLRRSMRGAWRMIAPLSFALSSAPVVLWRALTHRPAVILMVEPTLLSAPAGLLAAKLVGARTALHVQDLEIDAAFGVGHLKNKQVKRLAQAFERSVLKRFDRVITISNQMRDRLAAKGLPDERLAIQRNWVNLDKLRPLGRPSRFRDELGISEDTYVVLYAGAIGAKQALDVVMDAAAKLASVRDILFVIAGDGPEKPALQARQLSNVRFLPLQPEDRLCELLNLADLHVLPQHASAADLVLPSKLGGMLASGKPILVTADPGTELYDFLEGAASIVPAGNAKALQAAILELRCKGEAGAERRLELARRLSAGDALERFSSLLLGDAGRPVSVSTDPAAS